MISGNSCAKSKNLASKNEGVFVKRFRVHERQPKLFSGRQTWGSVEMKTVVKKNVDVSIVLA